jgi:hypothetical protein
MTTTNSFTITCPGHDPERCSRGHRRVDHLGDDAPSSAARRRPAYGGATRSHHPDPRGPFCGKHSGRETMAEEHSGQPTPWPASTVADELHGRQPIAAAEEPLPTTQHIHRLRKATRPSSPVASTARNTRVCRRQAPKALSIGGFWSRGGGAPIGIFDARRREFERAAAGLRSTADARPFSAIAGFSTAALHGHGLRALNVARACPDLCDRAFIVTHISGVPREHSACALR